MIGGNRWRLGTGRCGMLQSQKRIIDVAEERFVSATIKYHPYPLCISCGHCDLILEWMFPCMHTRVSSAFNWQAVFILEPGYLVVGAWRWQKISKLYLNKPVDISEALKPYQLMQQAHLPDWRGCTRFTTRTGSFRERGPLYWFRWRLVTVAQDHV